MNNTIKKRIIVALCGNPNSGKTSIFNELTGSHQHVGNWPGVTVEKKQGEMQYADYELQIIDLPGIYGLTAVSIEELIARNFIINERPDVIINVVDATALERGLYLTTQLIELGVRGIIALNMSDEADKKGITIDTEHLGLLLGMPVVKTIGNQGDGLDELINKAVLVSKHQEPKTRHIHIDYGRYIEEEIRSIQQIMRTDPQFTQRYSTRWLSLKILEQDTQVQDIVRSSPKEPDIASRVLKSRGRIQATDGEEADALIADARFGFIQGALKESVRKQVINRRDLSQQIDVVLTHRFWGFPIFAFLLWGMFQLTFILGEYPKNWIEFAVQRLGAIFSSVLPAGILKNLVIEGIIPGVGGVVVFLPNIMILFLCIALLEDTGYLARTVFIMDKIMHKIGLHGQSFIPLIMGFGCNVPAILAARTLQNESDRILTILINPLMSCSARLPIYILLASAFFPGHAGNVVASLYVLGIILAMIMGQLLRKTLFRHDIAPFVMELPPYRLPTIKSIWIHMWCRSSLFLKKVGGIILAASIIIWALTFFPVSQTAQTQGHTPNLEYSFAGRIGKCIEPVLKPLGFDWKMGVALITGVAAKEIVVSTLQILHLSRDHGQTEEHALTNALRQSSMTPLSAYAFMVFTLIYIPCLGTMGVMHRELGKWKWTLLGFSYSLALAWLVSFIIYQGGKLIGLA